MDWLQNLNHAIEYIEEHLTEEISYDEVAKIACCSTYNFQRMFSYIAGIPLSDYIRRRRMTAAAFDLQLSEDKVMDIGSKYCYEIPSSFNRAFQSVHNVTPSLARKEGTVLNTYSRISFSINVNGGEGMRYRVETKEPIRFVGVRTPLTEKVEDNFEIVPAFWDKSIKSSVFSLISKLPENDPHGILGVSVYKNPDDIYYYIGAATDSPVRDNMIEYEIPSATWVIFECSGGFPDSIQSVFKRFYMEWLPFSGYEYAELPDIEVYPVSDHRLKGGHTEIWIAVKKK